MVRQSTGRADREVVGFRRDHGGLKWHGLVKPAEKLGSTAELAA
jgi:hypothetical protein